VLAQRPREPGSHQGLLLQLSGHAIARVLRLGPLREPSVSQLVRERLPGADEDFCRACAGSSGGNPFLLNELLSACEAEGIAPVAAEAERIARLAPETLLRTTLARLSRLPEATRPLIRGLAVLGGSSDLRHATELAGLEPAEAAQAADALAAIDILRPGEELVFSNPLLHSTIESDIPAGERGLLHLRAAKLLAADETADYVASHLLHATATGDPWVVETLRHAAAQAISTAAPASAAGYLRRALSEPPSLDQRPQLLLELGDAEAAAGEPTALERVEEAIPLLDDPRERARALLRLGWMLHKSGRIAESGEPFRSGLAVLEREGASGEEVENLERELTTAYLCLTWQNQDLNPQLARRRHALVEGRGPLHGAAERSALAQILLQKALAGEPHDEITRLSLRVLDDGRLLSEESSDSFAFWVAVGCLSWADELDLSESAIEDALADARRRGAFLGIATALYGRCWPRLWRGHVSEAIADAQAAVNAWQGGWGMYLPIAKFWLATALIERDDLDAAEAALELPDGDRWASPMRDMWLAGRGSVALARGRADQALELLRNAGELSVRELRIANPAVIPWRADAALAAARLGDEREARRLIAEELEQARRFGAARPLGITLRAAGLVEAGEEGIELLREAVATLGPSPSRLEYARALIDLGSLLRRSGRRVEAREPLREGLTMTERFGALRLERQARAELEASGARVQRLALTGSASLTPSERRVAALAAEGMTNREIAQTLFVTVKAVKFHLHNAYGKLEVASRVDLRQALTR
jgi:DNA-binding CsgD family transcriptional regulator